MIPPWSFTAVGDSKTSPTAVISQGLMLSLREGDRGSRQLSLCHHEVTRFLSTDEQGMIKASHNALREA